MIKYEVTVDGVGNKFWRVDGKFHREDGPAIEHADGFKEWFIKGKLHREDGPAIEWVDGSKTWWANDELHRTDGPAIVLANGLKEWYIDGKQMTEQEFNARKIKELTVAEIEKLLGYSIKIVK